MKAAVHLDHLAHWVEDIAAAAAALEAMGFSVTPYAEHRHALEPGAAPVPAGSANRCVMLEEGYLELLTPTSDTPVAREVRRALARHVGVHLAAFEVANAGAERERLVAAGFAQRPTVSLERETETENGGRATLRFTVVRPEVGCLPEGRVQFLTHHTPDLLWQPRWLEHANSARGLTDMLFCVDDAQEAAERYTRYLGTHPEPVPGGVVFQLTRGRLALLETGQAAAALPGAPLPAPPCMAAYAIACGDLDATRALLAARGVDFHVAGEAVLWVSAPPALGGVIAFTGPGARAPWLA